MTQCLQCFKPEDLCVCSSLKAIPTRLHVLILQHPQEPKEALSTARLAHLALPNSILKIGLSWPNLRAALGRDALPSKWAVLYLGSGVKNPKEATALQFVNKSGTPVPAPTELEGVVILDGTWSQAKALWWRNAWLLKLRRVVLNPIQTSLYKELRKEPRKECLSTIECIAETLIGLGEPTSAGDELKTLFSYLLQKQRKRLKERSQKTQKN